MLPRLAGSLTHGLHPSKSSLPHAVRSLNPVFGGTSRAFIGAHLLHSFIQSFIHSFIHSFICSLMRKHKARQKNKNSLAELTTTQHRQHTTRRGTTRHTTKAQHNDTRCNTRQRGATHCSKRNALQLTTHHNTTQHRLGLPTAPKPCFWLRLTVLIFAHGAPNI